MVLKTLSATLEERESKKGNTYQCVVIKISPNIEKLAFLTQAEVELLKMQSVNK